MTQTTETKKQFKLSEYQQNILDWIVHVPEGNAIVNAVAGSGKSTTLKLIAIALHNAGIDPKDIRIIVFGKQNSLDLIAKFGEHWRHSIATLHSTGFQILAENVEKIRKVDANKYRKIAKQLGHTGTPKYPGQLMLKEAIGKESQFLKLLELTRLNLQEPLAKNLKAIAQHYGLDEIYSFEECSVSIQQIINLGKQLYLEDRIIDYKD